MKLYRGVRELQQTIQPQPLHEDDFQKFKHLGEIPTNVIWAANDRFHALVHGLLRDGSYAILTNPHERPVVTLRTKPLDEYRTEKATIYILEFDSEGFKQTGHFPEWFRTEPISNYTYQEYSPSEVISILEGEYDTEFHYEPRVPREKAL